MTKISAKIIADSKNQFGNRITTMVITFPRFLLAELNTHRMFSRNSASSRAIPFEKMVKSIEGNPFTPIAWQKDHKGMQGTEYINKYEKIYGEVPLVEKEWLDARNAAIKQAKQLNSLGVTKQLCNRLLEPFMWHTVIITATEWENFFSLRCPQYLGNFSKNIFRSKKDAIKKDVYSEFKDFEDLDWLISNKGQSEIHMMALAEAMWDAYNESTPKELKTGEWHIPFGNNIDPVLLKETVGVSATEESRLQLYENAKVKIATARCARISYTVVGDENREPNYEKDIELHDMLLASGHASPMEHIAKCADNFNWYGNFKGWKQYRKILEFQNLL